MCGFFNLSSRQSIRQKPRSNSFQTSDTQQRFANSKSGQVFLQTIVPSLNNLYRRSQGRLFRKGSANLWMSVTCRSLTSQTSLSTKKMIYLADHRPEKNSDEYSESIRWLYLFCDKIITSAKLVHIC